MNQVQQWARLRARTTCPLRRGADRKSTRLNSSHSQISYAVFCLKKKNAIYSVRGQVQTTVSVIYLIRYCGFHTSCVRRKQHILRLNSIRPARLVSNTNPWMFLYLVRV